MQFPYVEPTLAILPFSRTRYTLFKSKRAKKGHHSWKLQSRSRCHLWLLRRPPTLNLALSLAEIKTYKKHTQIGRFRPHIPWPTPIIDYCLEAHWACASFEIKFTVVPVQIMAGRRYKWRFSAKTSLKNTLIARFRPHIAWPTPIIDCYLEVYWSCASFEIKFTVVPTQVMAGWP